SKAISSATLSEKEWSGAAGFSEKILTFSEADYDLGAGRTLVLRLGVQSGSNPLLIAYGTSEHAARLAIELS
ncbi:MAG: hypothetical protein M3Q68_08665, partial [Actinomycetota bacterium]|nr:hypothetical protein [Actinomycetota bacterium]